MMRKPAAIAAVAFILAAIIFLLNRRTGEGTDTPDESSGRHAGRVLEKHPPGSRDNGPSSKSGDRATRSRPKVTTTPSGLRYEILREGSGPRPGPTDVVKVHYHGTTLDGKVFDSSVERGRPTTFPLNRVIKGWTEGLQLMRVGAKYRFTIPPELAYGERGANAKIGPNETLVFEVELLELPPGQ